MRAPWFLASGLLLVACGLSPANPQTARLTAAAQVGGQAYAFDCNPTAAGPIDLNHDPVGFGCASADGQARLTLTLREWQTGRPEEAPAATVDLTVGSGGAGQSYSGGASLSGSSWRGPTSSGRVGRFSVSFGAGGGAQGSYSLTTP